MNITLNQIEFIEQMKYDLGIDHRLGSSFSDLSRDRGHSAGIGFITPQQGEDISKKIFNPTILRIVSLFDGKKS